MLIRSQDKKLLVSYASGLWQAQNSKVYWLSLNNGDYWLEFAVYTSEEKAIKLLDTIQDRYQDYIKTTSLGLYKENIYGVFQIPSEDEIDEPTVKDIIKDIMDM